MPRQSLTRDDWRRYYLRFRSEVDRETWSWWGGVVGAGILAAIQVLLAVAYGSKPEWRQNLMPVFWVTMIAFWCNVGYHFLRAPVALDKQRSETVETKDKEIAQLHLQVAESKKDALPADAPQIMPIKFDKAPLGFYGLEIENEGETAICFTMERAMFGNSRLQFDTEFPRLSKSQGKVMVHAWIETPHNSCSAASLRDQMIYEGVEELTVRAHYQDARFRWYESTFKVARHFQLGLKVTLARQRLVSAEEAQAREKLAQEWRDLANRFSKLSDEYHAHWQHGGMGDGVERWEISGTDAAACEKLCAYAGKLLSRSPRTFLHLKIHNGIAITETDPIRKWLYFLKENHNALRMDRNYGLMELENGGKELILLGTIVNLAKRSEQACCDCASEES